MQPFDITIRAYGFEEKEVKPSGPAAGRVYVPKSWVGKKVKVVLVEPVEDE